MSDPLPYLDPLNLKLIEDTPGLEHPNTNVSDKELVQEFRQLVQLLGAHKKLLGVQRKSFLVPFEEGAVRTWIYKPQHVGDEPLPFVYYLHGGGWIAGK